MTPQKQHKRLPKRVTNRRNWINTADYDTRTAELESFVFCVSQFRWFLIEFILFYLPSAWFASPSLGSNHTRTDENFPENDADSEQFQWKSWFDQRRHLRHVVFCFSWFTRQNERRKVAPTWKFSLRKLASNLVDEKVVCASAQSSWNFQDLSTFEMLPKSSLKRFKPVTTFSKEIEREFEWKKGKAGLENDKKFKC